MVTLPRMADATVHTHAVIEERISEVLYRVILPNGKRILAHLSKPLSMAKAEFAVAQRLRVELTAYDFDQARILGAE